MSLKVQKEPPVDLPPPDVLRKRLSLAMRDVDILSGLLRLSERVAKRDGGVALPPNQTDYSSTETEAAHAAS